jgi:glutaminase
VAPVIEALLAEVYELYKTNSAGVNSQVYPALASAPDDLFGICVASTNGNIYTVGDAEYEFTIMSVAKPFVFALVCEHLGPDEVRERIGVNSAGFALDSVAAIERSAEEKTNPMVHPGAMATTSLVPGANARKKWEFIQNGLSRFAGRPLSLNREVYESASRSDFQNRSIANLLRNLNRISTDPAETTDLYTRQSSVNVSALDLAVMGATLADGGVNAVTKEQVVDADCCRYALAVMATAGLYETSGDWLYDVGLPGKSGIGGGIVTVSPGKGGLGTFAPPLDEAGNSIKGQLATKYLAKKLGMNLFLSQPVPYLAA